MELVALLGSSVGGKGLGMFSDFISERRHQGREEEENKHIQDLASRDKLKGYYESINAPLEDGNPSPLAYVIAFSIGLFAITYCLAALSCFFWEPTAVILTKDPAEDARAISFLFGFIEWDLSNDRILSMSKIGLGFLMLYPIVFILSMVTTGDKLKRR